MMGPARSEARGVGGSECVSPISGTDGPWRGIGAAATSPHRSPTAPLYGLRSGSRIGANYEDVNGRLPNRIGRV